MTTRIIAWVLVLAAIYGAYTYVKGYQLPWKTPPVANLLPKLPDDCNKKDCAGGAK